MPPTITTVNAQEGGNVSPRRRMKNLVSEWERLRRDIEKILDLKEQGAPYNEDTLRQQRRAREEVVDSIQALVRRRPQLAEVAVNSGFRADLLPQRGDADRPTGINAPEATLPKERDGGRDDDTDDDTDDEPRIRPPRDDRDTPPRLGEGWKLPGIKGKDFTIVRSPKGTQLAVYKIKVGGNVVKIAVQLPRKEEELSKYGVKKGEGRQLTKAQMDTIQNIGHAEEIGRHFRGEDRNPFQALKRELKKQYGGQPILDDDEVMGLIIANSVLEWTPGVFENQLRQTKWYDETNSYQRDYALTMSAKDKRDVFREYLVKVEEHLEDAYGDDWYKHVKGGRKQAREWAEKIASGQMGLPDKGFNIWADTILGKAEAIEGTPAWMMKEAEQEELRARANRPEEMVEQLRSQSMEWLGPRSKPDHDTLLRWATDLVTQNKSTADWMQWLRGQSRALHPWKDENVAWQDVASSYKAILEDLYRTPIDWDDKLLTKLGNEEGKAPMSAHEFELRARQDDRAWQEGTRVFDEVTAFGSQLANIFQGVSF